MVQHVVRWSATATASVRRAIRAATDSFNKGFWGAMGGTAAAAMVYLAHKWLTMLLAQ